MQPQQPSGTPAAPSGSDPYDFILQYNHPGSGMHGSSSTTSRILIVAGGAVILLVAAFIFFKVVSKPSNPTAALMVSVAQQQTEMARIATQAATEDAVAQPTIDFATTAQLSLQSDQQSLLALLKEHGSTPSDKLLAATQSSQTDSQLTAAKAAGAYDQAFAGVMQNELNTYEQTLKQAFAASQSATEKQWLQTAYGHAQSLVTMSKQTE